MSYAWLKNVVGKAINSDFVASLQNPMVQRMVNGYEYPVMAAFFMATDFFPEGYRKGRRISFVHSVRPLSRQMREPAREIRRGLIGTLKFLMRNANSATRFSFSRG